MSWTPDRHLRFTVFLRMRPDKPSGPPTKTTAGDLLLAMDNPADEQTVTVEGNTIHLTHLSKELWPATDDSPAVTKRDLVRYYALVSDAMLPHLKDRPIAFVRHPRGIGEKGFFQKHPLPGTPDFVKRVKIWSEHGSEALEWVMCQNLSSLIWFAQICTIEIHPWYSRITPEPGDLGVNFECARGLDTSALNHPDFVVFDLDPNIKGSAKALGAARGFDEDAWKRTSNVALALRQLLDSVHLKSFVKLSGKTGIHVFVPLERIYDYDQTKGLAEQFGRHLEAQMPEEVTMVWSVKKRPNAVFFDHNQNVRGKTLASAYSPRVAPGAPVSFPVEWDEIGSVSPKSFTLRTAPGILQGRGDSWRSILDVRQKIG